MAKHTETMTKEETCRKHVANFLSALNFHDDNPQTTIKVMRMKLAEIQRKEEEAATVLKKPPTIRKITIKFGGSNSIPKKVVLKRPHSETLISGNNDIETLISKRQKMNTNNVMEFIRSMGGLEAELVVEKRLTSSDVNDYLGRLMMPVLKVKNPRFLTVDEKMRLGNKRDLSVRVFDVEKRRWTLNLGKWRMGNEYYALKTNWNDIVKANGLKEGTVIRVLSFRIHQQLCLALVRVA